jgi:lysophospholipase L1-like esterase
MSRGVRARLLLGGLAALFLPPLGAHAAVCQDCLGLSAGGSQTGWISLSVRRSEPVRVTLTEQIGDAQQPIADVAGGAPEVVVRHAEIWRCDRRDRRFVATATFADGVTQTVTQTLRTPSCGKRLTLAASASKHGGSRRIAVRLTDRWGVGDVPARACVAAPGRKLACRSVRIPGGRKQTRLSYRAGKPGLWSVVLQTAWGQSATGHVYVRPAGGLRLLATGDSMIEYVDAALKDRLAGLGVEVRSDARVSTGLSKPFLLDWPRLAKHQAATVRPDVTVVFVGANDGFPFGTARCCGNGWVDAYATRAKEMMDAYSRRGRGLVYWLTLPAPRPAEWRPVYPAVNRALKRAAAGFGGRVRVLDIAKVFTPGNRFRSSIVWQGRRQTVRQDDGIHLSQAGASIAEVLIQRALRQDGAID